MSINYSDGRDVESRILEFLHSQKTLNSSDPLGREHYQEWAFRYHLSPERANLLRPFDFSGLDVLEMGAGMGAISRYLAENAKSLTIVEGTKPRFDALSTRLKDLSNWTGTVSNLVEYESDKTFDVVCMIGVLEYSELFVPGPTPFFSVLKKLHSLLNPGGALVLAIENRMGLKYLSGAAEDHTGKPYDGVCGYPLQKSPRTFSRSELSGLLRNAGFDYSHYYYPFPDYKVPTSLLSDSLVEKFPLFAADIASATRAENYGHPQNDTIPHVLGLRSFAKADLLKEVSNSFLIVASDCPRSPIADQLRKREIKKKEIGWHYASLRTPATQTIFSMDNKQLFVEKESLANTKPEPLTIKTDTSLTWSPIAKQPATHGKPVRWILAKHAYYQQWDEFLSELNTFISWSLDHWRVGDDPKLISGKAIDAVFTNAIKPPNSNTPYVLIDLEWSTSSPMPASWFIFRNIFNLVRDEGLITESAPHPTLKHLYMDCCAKAGIEANFAQDVDREAELQHVTDRNTDLEAHRDKLVRLFNRSNPDGTYPRVPEDRKQQIEEQRRWQNETAKTRELHASLSKSVAEVERLQIRLDKNLVKTAEKISAVFANSHFFHQRVKPIILDVLRLSKAFGWLFRIKPKSSQRWIQKSPNTIKQNGAFHVPIEADSFSLGFASVQINGKFPKNTKLSLIASFETESGEVVSTQHPVKSGRKSARTIIQMQSQVVRLEFLIESPVDSVSVASVEYRSLSRPEVALSLSGIRLAQLLKNPKEAWLVYYRKRAYLRTHEKAALRTWLRDELLHAGFVVIGGYSSWVELYDTLSDSDRTAIKEHIASFEYKPLISVLLPTYNIEEAWLRQAIESVSKQLYPNWELCIADDASTKPHVKKVIQEYAKRDPRIRTVIRKKNGHISAASNSALKLASGEFVALLDHDDEFAEHALYMVAELLNRHPDTDLIYSDEDKKDIYNHRYGPHFKCDWNPDLFYSMNLVTHLAVFRTSLVQEVGGFQLGMEGSQDYDLTLRVVEKTTPERIRHIPHILYHWRAIPGSVALASAEKDYAHPAARRAIQAHLDRTQAGAVVETGYAPLHRVRYQLPEVLPSVTFIVCTRDRADLLRTVIEGLTKGTDYDPYKMHILIVNNQSTNPRTYDYFNEISGDPRIEVIDYDAPFNFSQMNNLAVEHCNTELVAFINNDLEFQSDNWLKEMVSFAIRPEFGAIGAKLYYPDNRIQHAGIILGIGGVADHPHRFLKKDHAGYVGRANIVQSFSAVSAACMVLRRELFLSVGGFDADQLQVAYNDVDLCLKIRARGFRNIYTPYAEVMHHESASRGSDLTPSQVERFRQERDTMFKRWESLLLDDPAYNANLSLHTTNHSFAFPPRAHKPWKKTVTAEITDYDALNQLNLDAFLKPIPTDPADRPSI